MKQPLLRRFGRAALALAVLGGLAWVVTMFGPAALFRTRLSAPGKTEIVRRPPPADSQRGALTSLPRYVPDKGVPFQVDLRGRDLAHLDLTDRLHDLQNAVFDARTRWPAKLPAGFIPAETLERNKNPGLGVRTLHARGITGRGIGVGIIDQALLTEHVEYADRLRLYEEIHVLRSPPADMHGTGIASIAVGQTVGVAPGANRYFIANYYKNFVPIMRQ